MIARILAGTPPWVWALLAALLWLGISQSVARTVGLGRIASLPVAMTGLSFYGTISVFGSAPAVLLAWLAAAGSAAWWTGRRPLPEKTAYDPATNLFTLPGSWLPLALIMGIFLTKYAVGASLAMQPGMNGHAGFAMTVGALYGAFSGVFIGRAGRLWHLAKRQQAPALDSGRGRER